jgi:hypothetical protein
MERSALNSGVAKTRLKISTIRMNWLCSVDGLREIAGSTT